MTSEHDNHSPPERIIAHKNNFRRRFNRVVRRFEHVAFWAALGMSALYFLLQMPAVQNTLVGFSARMLSDALDNTVSVRHVDIQFFDNLLIEGVYVSDRQGDTLAYVERLSASLNSNIFSLFRDKLEFNELALYGARVHLDRPVEQFDFNIRFIVDFFSSSEKKKKKTTKPFSLRIQNLRLRDISFEQTDQLKGKRLYAYLNTAVLRLDQFQSPENRLTFSKVLLDGLRFDMQEYSVEEPGGDKQPEAGLEPPADSIEQPDEPADTLWISIHRFALNNGYFGLDRYDLSALGTLPDSVMDFEHLLVDDISLKADSVQFNDQLQFEGILQHMAAQERSGFAVTHAHAKRVLVNDTITALYGLELNTNGSRLGDTIALHYEHYQDYIHFVNKVFLDIQLKAPSELLLRDVTYFSAPLARNTFFINNDNRVAGLRGRISGVVNRLNGRDIFLDIGESSHFEGDFDVDDVAEGVDLLRMQFDCKSLQSNMKTLRSVIPGFSVPGQFDALGNFSFAGSYRLLFGYNHIASGNLYSDVGHGTLDMLLDLTDGRDKATYSGELNMHEFNMAAWTDNPDFGKSAFKLSIAEGSSGLRLASMKTAVEGVVDTLYFKGYPYSNFALDAELNGYNFNGNIALDDPNIKVTLDGTANLSDSLKVFAVTGEVENANLGALNLVDKDWRFSGKINKIELQGQKLDNISGTANLENLVLFQDSSYVHFVDSVYFRSLFQERDSSRRYELLSDVADAYLNGKFNLTTLAPKLASMYAAYYPKIGSKLGLVVLDSTEIDDVFDFNIRIKDTRDLTRLVVPELDTLRELTLFGRVNEKTGFSELKLDAPFVRYGSLAMRRIDFKWHNLRDVSDYDFLLPQVETDGGQKLSALRLYGTSQHDEVHFSLQAQDTSSVVRGIDLNGVISVTDSLWQLQFNTSNIELFNEEWVMDDRNYLRFGGGYFDAQEFELMNGDRRITFSAHNENRGMQITTTNLNLNYLNRFIPDTNLTLSANIYDFDCRVDDLYRMQGLHLSVNTDTVYINGNPYGILQGDIDQESSQEPFLGKIFLRQASSFLRINGAFVPSNAPDFTDPELKTVKSGELASRVSATTFPLVILETFVPGISETMGSVDLEATVEGSPEEPNLTGKAHIGEGQLQIDYLKTPFKLRNQDIILNNTQIWAEGDTLTDVEGNPAVVHGGLRHNRFSDWEIQCSVESLNNLFLVMNTQKKDNDLFYGTARGGFRANFSGTFARPNISVTARTGAGTKLFIPLGSSNEVQSVSFIRFVNGQKLSDGPVRNRYNASAITGLNFDLNVSVNDDSEVQLIFDERTGDIIKGNGKGDLRITINREGEFKMHGGYLISKGDYLFTLLNLVNKPFKVVEGGTINWFGDPYGAQIQLDATYTTSSSTYNLLSSVLELTGSEDLISEAGKPTQVVVTMHLKGDLFKPVITFDLAFPQLGTRLRSLAESKLRVLEQDQNELTRQVFGLVVVGTFLPTNTGFGQSSEFVTTAFNTLSQVFTNQLSNYLTGLASEWFSNKKVVSSIDLDIMYSQYRNDVLTGGSSESSVGNELQVRLSSGFANDRIILNIGSQFGTTVTPGATIQQGFLGEDVSVEIGLTENNQWRLRVYQRTEPDITGGQRRNRFGVGLNFRKDYNSFVDMMDELTRWMRKRK